MVKLKPVAIQGLSVAVKPLSTSRGVADPRTEGRGGRGLGLALAGGRQSAWEGFQALNFCRSCSLSRYLYI